MKHTKFDYVGKNGKPTKDMIADIMTCYVQDILRKLVYGGRFSSKQAKKFFKSLMKDLVEKK